jgi:hypothetical protein
MRRMRIVHPDGRIWDHFTDEPNLLLGDVKIRFRHVGEGDDGPAAEWAVVHCDWVRNEETGRILVHVIVQPAGEADFWKLPAELTMLAMDRATFKIEALNEDGGSYPVKIAKVVHGAPANGGPSNQMEIFVDASREKVIN